MIIVPPVATAVRKRATRNPLYQGEKADSTPEVACRPIAVMSGSLRPILKTKDTKYTLHSQMRSHALREMDV
jgi:hypothetical protein